MSKMPRTWPNCEKTGTMLRAIALSTLILAAYLPTQVAAISLPQQPARTESRIWPVAKLRPLNPRAEINADTVYPISLTCPTDNFGRLELITRNADGDAVRLRVIYPNGIITFDTRSKKENDFKRVADSSVGDASYRHSFEKGKEQADAMMKYVCSSAATIARYQETMENNLAIFEGRLLPD